MSDAFTAATQLLLGDHPSRDEVMKAGELYREASSQGHSEASERLALFEAIGMMGPQSWGRALDWLEQAARQGSQGAREQLLLLSDNLQSPSVPDDTEDHFWRTIRARIDIEARIALASSPLVVSDSPRIRLFKQFATAPECRWLIGRAEKRMTRATVFDQTTGEQTHAAARDNSFFGLPLSEMNVFTEVLRNRISRTTRLPLPLFEPSQLLHYSIGQSFDPHYDFLDPANAAYCEELARGGQRIGTFLIYLNSGYAGGETSFPKIGLSIRGDEGDALFFANVTRDGTPDPKTLHAGLPPTSGEKWIFSQWIRDRLPDQ